ncbi:MAG: metallophosphoesterase family protein [Chloroflexota bacterium]
MTSIAVISDIHGNCTALDAVLADLARSPADVIVCLGDAIQGGPQPAQVVQRLRELACPVVMGNADAWLLTGEITSPAEAVTEKQLAVREWQLSQLSQVDRAFIASFKPTVEIALEGGVNLLCFHGSPTSFDDVILPETPEEEFVGFLGAWRGHLLTGGHTHLQQIRRLGDYFFFNPGSVGVSYDRNQPTDNFQLDHHAEYAVLTSGEDRLTLEFRRVPFDVNRHAQALIASSRPYGEDYAQQYKGRPDQS